MRLELRRRTRDAWSAFWREGGSVPELRAELEEAKAMLVSLDELHAEPGKIDAKLSGDAVKLLARLLTAHLADVGAENYLEMCVHDAKGNKWYDVTAKRREGKSPHVLRREAEAERDALQVHLDDERVMRISAEKENGELRGDLNTERELHVNALNENGRLHQHLELLLVEPVTSPLRQTAPVKDCPRCGKVGTVTCSMDSDVRAGGVGQMLCGACSWYFRPELAHFLQDDLLDRDHEVAVLRGRLAVARVQRLARASGARGVPVAFAFKDWTRAGESIYQSEEGIDLSLGDFHSGTVFNGTLALNAAQYRDLVVALEGRAEPVFLLFEAGEPDAGDERGVTAGKAVWTTEPTNEDGLFELRWERHSSNQTRWRWLRAGEPLPHLATHRSILRVRSAEELFALVKVARLLPDALEACACEGTGTVHYRCDRCGEWECACAGRREPTTCVRPICMVARAALEELDAARRVP